MWAVQATRGNFVPVLAGYTGGGAYTGGDRTYVQDEFAADLAVRYAPSDDLAVSLTWPDLDKLGLTPRSLRRLAVDELKSRLGSAQLHCSSSILMVSCHGIESSLLLVDDFWPGLVSEVPGDLVVGVPARDVLVITGSRSAAGLAKARRCVDRVFYAGDRHLLSRELLVWRDPGWEIFDPAPERPGEDIGEWAPGSAEAARVWTPTEGRGSTNEAGPSDRWSATNPVPAFSADPAFSAEAAFGLGPADERVLAPRRQAADLGLSSFTVDDWPAPRRRSGRARRA